MQRRPCRDTFPPSEGFRIGVDIGGTFTDLVLVDHDSGRLTNEKVLTTPRDPSEAVLAGVAAILERAGRSPADALPVIHGTTLVANALIERKGVRTALLTSAGFRDVLEIGREWRYDLYDLGQEPPRPLVPRHLRFEVAERLAPDGSVVEPLDEAAVASVARSLADAGVDALAVCFLHSFTDPSHERRAREIVARHAPRIRVSLSSEVMPEIGEYERMSTTVANAYVQPIFEAYIERLSASLRAMGIERDLFLMLADGGTVHQDTAKAHPIRLVQSGPAGGAQATALIGRDAGERRILCFDMGGTTAKACLIEDGDPERTTEFEVARVYRFKKGSGLPLRVPVIDMIEIGAGGGSEARIDRLGLLKVGPESAGAEPGPACYGRGGAEPTVTDADLVLGYLDAAAFLGGDMALDRAAAEAAIRTRIAEPLGLGVPEAAWGIHDSVNEAMAQAASIHALEKAKRIGDYALVAIGGAGPVHACQVARKLGMRRVVAPLGAGVASALGFLASPLSFSFVQGDIAPLDRLDPATTGARVGALEAEGRRLLAGSGVGAAAVAVRLLCAMRYVGQGHEVEVELPPDSLARGDRDAIRARFLEAYARLYGRTERGGEVETVSWRVIVSGPRPHLDLAAARAGASVDGDPVVGRRKAWFPEAGYTDTPVHDRYRLAPGTGFDGPAIVEERESTVIVPPGARCRIDDARSLIVDLPR